MTINEIDRLVIEFKTVLGQRNLYPISQESQVWLVCEQHHFDKPPIWRMVQEGINWSYSLISSICSKEVIEAEFFERLNQGKFVKAEAYIGLWRAAMDKAISISALVERGLALQCSFTNSTQYLLGKDGEYKALAVQALESTYLTARDDNQCTWEFNLDCLEACEAHYLLSRQRPYGKEYDHLYSESVKLVNFSAAPAMATQPAFDLFTEMAVSA